MSRPLIYVVDDEENIRRLLEFWISTKWGYELRLFASGEECLKALDDSPSLVVLDINLPGLNGLDVLRELRRHSPDLPVLILSAQGNIDVAVEAIKLGALDYFSKSIDLTKLEIAIRNALQLRHLQEENARLRENVVERGRISNIITAGGPMEEVLGLVARAAGSAISVLIQGESGTGKELIARAIHTGGPRSSGPFVAVNCAAIPKELLESEMFGHEKGAFTGAVTRKIGRFEQADGGTIFLDEIGELDLNLQAKLLRVIQEREFQRVGGSELLSCDVRIISATHRDLLKASRSGSFREDLFYRLSTFPILLPPLRRRPGDILLLAEHFLKKFADREKRAIGRFEKGALRLLQRYPWPGNVRELESAIERAVLLCDGDTVVEADLPLTVRAWSDGDDDMLGEEGADRLFRDLHSVVTLEELKEAAARHALALCDGNVAEAASRLGISRSTMYDLMKRGRITPSTLAA